MFILISVVFVTLINLGNADYHSVNIQLLEDFFVKPRSFKRDNNAKWFHNGVPVNQSSNRYIVYENGTLKVMQAEASDYGPYQKCVRARCSAPIYAEVQDLHQEPKNDIVWVFKYDEPNTYTYRKPATEIQCGFFLPTGYHYFHVNWSYSNREEFQLSSSVFLVRNHTILYSSRYTYFYSSLILLQNPGDTIFTCRLFVQGEWDHFLKDEQDFFPNFSRFSQRVSLREYVRNTPKKDPFNYRGSHPNITLSSEKCDGSVNVTCSSKEGPVELYITSDVESLNRFDGSWFALTGRLLSLMNFSRVEMNGTYFSSHSFNSSEFLNQEVHVVCYCLDKYSFRRLEAQNCSTSSETHPHLSVFHRSLIFASCFLALILVVIVAVRWFLKRRQKLRIKRLQRRPSLIYQSIDAVEYQQPCPYGHDYVNISIAYCPLRSGSTESTLASAESSEDYLEPKRIELKSESQARSVRFHLGGESSPTPKSHKSPFFKSGDRRLAIANPRV
nr:hypothetical protein HmN_000303900 [Hymenolepis microstoma]